ncbi:hypothetical protein EWM64_g9193 [Hericium alpestre]|uniref:Uncharacterized protein n=1 Tax=Hericium alpestre TaxID=135208 RepID=A0A4Y9ZN26_9AGAM|nr:hypothetical protein EWM64_g9193 [Hericium alpestre]
MNVSNDWGQNPAQPVFTPSEPPPNGYQDERRHYQHTQPTPLQQEAEHTEYPHLYLPNNGPHHNFEGAPAQTPGRQLRVDSLSKILDPILWSETPSAPAVLQLAPSVAHSGEVQVNSASGAPKGRKRKARDEDAEVAGGGGSAPLSAPSSCQMVLRTRKGKGKARDEDIGAAEEGSSAPQWVSSLPEPGQEQFQRIPARLKCKGKARVPSTLLPPHSHGPFAGAPALAPGIPALASTYPSAIGPSVRRSGSSDLSIGGDLRRSGRLAKRGQSDGTASPQPALPQVPPPPATPTARAVLDRRKDSQKGQRKQRADLCLTVDGLMSAPYRVTTDDSKRGVPEQKILKNTINYIKALQKAYEDVEKEKSGHQENAALLWGALEECRVKLMVKTNECNDLKAQAETSQEKMARLQQEIDELKRN